MSEQPVKSDAPVRHSIAHRIRITDKGIRCLECPWGWRRTRDLQSGVDR